VKYEETWANYISKFISSYQSEGVPVWAITPQNEPENNPHWEACVWNASEQSSFIKNHLGPTLRHNHPDVKLLMYDHNRDHIVSWANATLSDHQASQYVDGIAFHAYNGFLWDELLRVHDLFPNKFLIGTESARCHMAPRQWYWAERTATDMIGDLNAWSVGFIDWNLILDINGGPSHVGSQCNALLMYDISAKKLVVNPAYYAMGQITKYVPAGSVRIGNSAIVSSRGVFVTAFLTQTNDVSVVGSQCRRCSKVGTFEKREWKCSKLHCSRPRCYHICLQQYLRSANRKHSEN